MKYITSIIITVLLVTLGGDLLAQQQRVEGHITDGKNNRKLDKVVISVYDMTTEGLVLSSKTDGFGKFVFDLPKDGSYVIRLRRQAYYDKEVFLDITGDDEYLKMTMTRLPGYELEATVRERLSYSNQVLGKELKNIKVEVYNNTTSKEIVVIDDDPENTFNVNFERGNHYTMLLRKKGYFAKRIEVYVDIEGCILCFEGLGSHFAPEIEAATTENNQRGSLIADIPMKKIIQDEAIALDNIFYDYDKSYIRKDARPALENLVKILKRNPIVIELSSHTDSRGKSEYNQTLSQKRADAAVDYIISRGITTNRITAKGYGESKLTNKCGDGVTCTEAEHQINRRTEFAVTKFLEDSSFDNRSLKEIIEQEKFNGLRSKESILIMEN